MSDPVLEKALLLIASTRAALMNGCLHYSTKNDRPLNTEREILECLRDEKQVRIDESKRVSVTTTEAELEKLQKAKAC